MATADEMSLLADVQLTMSAKPEGVGVVRQALAGMADALDFDAAILADMKMAVTEACTNVVVHAYPDAEGGGLRVDMLAGADGLTIVVRDHGGGIQPQPIQPEPKALGLGLPLIAALSDSFELKGSSSGGTEVRMTFAYVRAHDPSRSSQVAGALGEDGRWDPDAASPQEPASDRPLED